MFSFFKKPSLEDQVIELKMTSRTLNAQYKKAEQEAKNYENKMRAVVRSRVEITVRRFSRAIRKEPRFMPRWASDLCGNRRAPSV